MFPVIYMHMRLRRKEGNIDLRRLRSSDRMFPHLLRIKAGEHVGSE